MNRTFDDRLKNDLFPKMPDSFIQRIDDTLTRICAEEQHYAQMKRSRFLPVRIAAAAIALMIFASGCTFAIRPALAAEIPIVSEIVYTLAPTVEANKQKRAEIADTVISVLNSFAAGDTAGIGEKFIFGEDWLLNGDTMMAAYYLQYLAISQEIIAEGIQAEFNNVDITNVAADQKAFRYTADITFDMVLKEDVIKDETAKVLLEENTDGMRIVSIEMLSEGFKEYTALMNKHGAAEYSEGSLDDNIATYNAFIIFSATQGLEAEQYGQQAEDNYSQGDLGRIKRLEQLIREVEAADMPEADKQARITQLETEIAEIRERATPESLTMEELGAELTYRYYIARQTGNVPNLSDIMERNENTDLFFYDVQLMVEKFKLGYFAPLVTVESGYGEILEVISENEGTATCSMYVKTVIDGGVGEEMILTFRKDGDKYIIIGYDRSVGDGVYRNRLKPLADQYRGEGYSPAEANKKAYEELLNEAQKTAVAHPEYLVGKP